MHNYYTYLYNQAVFELLERERGTSEAVLFARSATVGGQQLDVYKRQPLPGTGKKSVGSGCICSGSRRGNHKTCGDHIKICFGDPKIREQIERWYKKIEAAEAAQGKILKIFRPTPPFPSRWVCERQHKTP